jgi:hypothetical protein
LTLDFVGKRYGKLPSEVMLEGSSLDIWIAELAVGYENYLNKKHAGNLGPTPAPNLSQDEMRAMIERVKKNENKV